MQLAPEPEWAPRLLQFWSDVFLATLPVVVTSVRELERKAGEDEGLVRRNDNSSGGGRPPDLHLQNKGRLATSKRGDFFFAVSARTSCVLFWWFDRGQRRRLLRDVNEACRALNWMHDEETRPPALPPSLVASENKNQCYRADVQ